MFPDFEIDTQEALGDHIVETNILADNLLYGHETAPICDLPDLAHELDWDIHLEENLSEFHGEDVHPRDQEDMIVSCHDKSEEDHAHCDMRLTSKSAVWERNRRMRLRERLLSLRAVVPNITKMDKASIIGDAIRYIHDLQSQTERVQADILSLQSGIRKFSSTSTPPHQSSKFPEIELLPHRDDGLQTQCFEISQLDITKVEDQIFVIRIACEKKPGLIRRLARALESVIGGGEIISANTTTFDSNVVVTTTAEVKKWETKQADEIKEIFLEAASIYGFGAHE